MSNPSPFQGKYNIDTFSYPIDIMGDEYGGNFAIFHIIIQSESKFNQSDVAPGAPTEPNRNTPPISATAIATVNALGGGALVKLLEGVFGKGGSLTGPIVGATVAGGAVAAVAAASGGFNNPVKQLKTTIALNIPFSVQTSYGMNYDEIEIPFKYLLAGALASSTSIKSFADTGTNALIAGALGTTGGTVSKLSKIAINPTKELIFQSVNWRTFSFNYNFAPKSEKEAQNVLNIIHQFKFHMHPEFLDTNEFLYIYPSEFDISYYSNGVENDKIHKHTSCILVDLNVNYTPNGHFSTFANGMPNQIQISMTFKELAKLDKKKIEDGGY